MKSLSECDFAAFEDLGGAAFVLEAGQLIVWEHGLTSLKEHCEYLEGRVKYHGDVWSQQQTVEIMQDLISRIRQIIRTNQGSA